MNKYKDFCYDLYKNSNLSFQEINSEINFVIEILTGLKSQDFYLGKELTETQKSEIREVLNEHIKTGKPLQYITGEAFFAGRKYFVNKYTLIPRPETEFLVRECIDNCNNKAPLILDIGTGSGCIAIELALNFPHAKTVAVDVCRETLDIARKNAERYGVSDRIDFVKSNLFEEISEYKFDIIVSNPPYISYSDIKEVQKDVFDFEPHMALFAEDDGLFFYNEIISNCKNFLNDNFLLAFEIGYKQAEKVVSILKKNHFENIILKNDCDGLVRIVLAQN